MREYPFISTNSYTSDLAVYDLLVRPQLLQTFSNYNRGSNCLEYCENTGNVNDLCEGTIEYKGGTINSTPFNPDDDNSCVGILVNDYSDYDVDVAGDNYLSGNLIQRLPIPPYSIVTSTFVRDVEGFNYAGYKEVNQQLEDYVSNSLAIHKYEINENILIGNINSSEMVIYNPSEVDITANNLIFPANYTFKTIRGTYPYYPDVVNANTPENGGPYQKYEDVPIETDLEVDYHISGYPTGNSLYASIYHLESGSKLTIEPCVKLFDCTFEVNPGSEIVFENTPTNLNKLRYQLLYNGGTVTERDEQWYFQNRTETLEVLNFEAADFIHAGNNVDNNQDPGNYVVDVGADVTFGAANQVVLKTGFHAKSGSKFHAYNPQVSVPGCPQRRGNWNQDERENFPVANKDNLFFLAPSLTTSKSSIIFKIEVEGHYSIEILNALGEVQKKIKENQFFRASDHRLEADFSDLAPGVYVCKLSNRASQMTTKFIRSN